jgi:pyrroline-5-carboxylate reductase
MVMKLLLIGCGKMGGAILQRAAANASTYVVDPLPPGDAVRNLPDVTWVDQADKLPSSFVPDLVLVAIKPQQIANVLPGYGRFKTSVFVSIVAGTTLARLNETLGDASIAVVRTMPNMPALVGSGVTVAIPNAHVSPAQQAHAEALMGTVGLVTWVKDEAWLDTVTALSGSGPGYIFAMTEAMAKAGEALGLPSALAALLARQTIIGSGALLSQSPESPEGLRLAVSSPGGTTEAAMKVLVAPGGLPELMHSAMKAALLKSRELAK